jgi:hypothetical protein
MGRGNINRINARLDDETEEKLRLIRGRTGKSITDIVISSLDLYYRSLKTERANAADILARNGFIGCGSDEPNLSVNYKNRLTSIIARKT